MTLSREARKRIRHAADRVGGHRGKPLTRAEQRWLEADTVLYFGYGMNMPLDTMSYMPDAERLGPARLPGWALKFAGFADVREEAGAEVHGALWRLGAASLTALDHREGYSPERPADQNMYGRREVTVETPDGPRQALVYFMTDRTRSRGDSPPSASYANLLRRGYTELALPMAALEDALTAAGVHPCEDCGGPIGLTTDSTAHRLWCPMREEEDDYATG